MYKVRNITELMEKYELKKEHASKIEAAFYHSSFVNELCLPHLHKHALSHGERSFESY